MATTNEFFSKPILMELEGVYTMKRDFARVAAKLTAESGPDFKATLAAAPLEGIDLTRPLDTGRRVDLW